MNADFGNLVLEHLRGIRSEIADMRREVRIDSRDFRYGVSSIERHLVNLQGDVALTHRRLDHLGERLERIERRLDLSEAPA